jgi:hypothetical protein
MGETWQVDGPKVIEVGSEGHGVRRVKLGLIGGRVDVVAHDEPEGRLEVQSVHGRPLDVSWDGETLEISHPHARWDGLLGSLADKVRGEAHSLDDTAELSLAVPPGVSLQIGTVSAEGLVVGLTGNVEVRTMSGTVTLDGVAGAVVARTVSGSVEARGQRGHMRMDSVSGSFTVQSSGAPSLSAKTVSGSLTVDAAPAVDAAAVGAAADAGAEVTVGFSSVSGGLVVRQVAGRGYDADLRSVSGRVVVGTERVQGDYGSVRHRRQDPAASLKVKASTVSGDITLLPSASAPPSAGVAAMVHG